MHEKFNKEINYIKNDRIKNSLIIMLDRLPDYFYHVPASSTGKYHPSFSLGEGGLLRHTKAAVRIAYELFNDESINNFTQDEKDLIIFSLTLHDGLKSGMEHSKYTKVEHPLLAAKYVKDNTKNLGMSDEDIEFICNVISSHMGAWNKDFDGNEVLPIPKNKYQNFVHMCDYLASRKVIKLDFDENNNIVE